MKNLSLSTKLALNVVISIAWLLFFKKFDLITFHTSTMTDLLLSIIATAIITLSIEAVMEVILFAILYNNLAIGCLLLLFYNFGKGWAWLMIASILTNLFTINVPTLTLEAFLMSIAYGLVRIPISYFTHSLFVNVVIEESDNG